MTLQFHIAYVSKKLIIRTPRSRLNHFAKKKRKFILYSAYLQKKYIFEADTACTAVFLPVTCTAAFPISINKHFRLAVGALYLTVICTVRNCKTMVQSLQTHLKAFFFTIAVF